MTVAVGTRLADRYLLLNRIGTGGMGSVWRAVDEVLDREVAVKVLAAAFADDSEFTQRFRREARAAARLDHPHITHVYDYGELTEAGQQVQYLIMELLAGQTLGARLHAGPMPWQEAVDIGAQVADALTAAHRHGVVHRDITPGNIMLTPAGAKVLDFGISRIAGDAAMTVAGRTLGTPAYLAPERVSGRPATPAVDVYALAAVLVHAITGRTPYEGSWSEQAHAHLHEPPPLLAGLPDVLARLLRACLDKDPAVRPTGEMLARSLRAQGGAGQLVTRSMPAPVLPAQAPETRVLPAYAAYEDAGAGRRARSGGIGRIVAWIALITAAAAAVIVGANLLADPPTSTPPADLTTSPPATTLPTETSPSAEESGEELTPEEEAFAEIESVVREALENGDIRPAIAADIGTSLERLVNQVDDQNWRGAERTLERLDNRLEDHADDGRLDKELYEFIADRLDILIDAVEEAGDD